MEEAIGFFRAFETWIYLLLGLGGLYNIRKFIQAWQELRSASFGFERERAQSRLNLAAFILVLLLTMVVTEFILVSFIAPAMPGSIGLPTPTLNLLATPSVTLPAETLQPGEPQTTVTPAVVQTVVGSGCVQGQIEIIIPENGEEISGVVPVVGSANIPNFGFYKFEIKRPDETAWLTIQAGNAPVSSGKLGDWDTSRLSPGDYQLALVVVDNQAIASTPCIIQLRVALPPALPPGP
jgi:hypothetical protein